MHALVWVTVIDHTVFVGHTTGQNTSMPDCYPFGGVHKISLPTPRPVSLSRVWQRRGAVSLPSASGLSRGFLSAGEGMGPPTQSFLF
jgi:hypothetical protein